MRNLRYIKLFEAFDARTLNATLNHIKAKADKTHFLNALKKICGRFDIPESKLGDDLFTYLPFNRALRFNNVIADDQPCDAVGEFIAGERCDNGKVRRPWGRGFRVVDCGTCKGTGIKPKKSSLSMIKFWFDSEGKFITTTAVDGVYRETSAANTSAFSQNIADYEVVKRIPKSRISELETGDIIALDLVNNGGWRNELYPQVVSYVMKASTWSGMKYFALQNTSSYYNNYPRETNGWNQIASRYWQMSQSRVNNINLLKPKANVGGLDPYGYNTSFELDNFRIRPVQMNATVKDANFAIILDFNKLMSFAPERKKSEIISDRTEMKSGALALMSDEDIKKANIKRYFDKIAQGFQLRGELDDISKFNRMAARLLGRNSTYFLNGSASDTISSGLGSIATQIFKVIKKIKSAEREDAKLVEQGLTPTAIEALKNNYDFKSDIEYINTKYKDILDWSIKSNEHTNKLLKQFRTKIEDTSAEGQKEKDLKVLDNLDRLSLEIGRYISSISVETLADVEFLQQEINSIRQIFRSDRTSLSSLSNFFDRMRPGSYYNSPDYLYSTFTDKRNYFGNINNGITVMINVIRRKQGQLAEAETNEAFKNIR
jgi:hypothetical protein